MKSNMHYDPIQYPFSKRMLIMIFTRMKPSLILVGGIMLGLIGCAPGAMAACDPGWGECPQSLGGGCAPLGAVCCPGGTHVPAGNSCPAEVVGYWGAIAVASWNDSSGAAHVASGVAWNYRTLSLASDAAMSQCQGYGGQNCQIVGNFSNGGCGYVAVGTGTGGVRWGIGPTPEEATAQCSAGGFVCKAPAGGCTSR